jgi:hypothetical protein
VTALLTGEMVSELFENANQPFPRNGG